MEPSWQTYDKFAGIMQQMKVNENFFVCDEKLAKEIYMAIDALVQPPTQPTNDQYIRESNKTDCDYDADVLSRLQSLTENEARIFHAAMGLATEAGEILDAVKKFVFYGKPLDLVNLKEEGGDSFWYLARLAQALGISFEDMMSTNLKKLHARYGGKFTQEKALTRDLKAEREVLEK